MNELIKLLKEAAWKSQHERLTYEDILEAFELLDFIKQTIVFINHKEIEAYKDDES